MVSTSTAPPTDHYSVYELRANDTLRSSREVHCLLEESGDYLLEDSPLTKPLYEGVDQSRYGCLGRNELGLDTIATHGFGSLLAEDCNG